MSSRSRTPLIIATVVVVVAVAAIAAVLATRGGGDGKTAGVVYGTVSVTGDQLPRNEGPDDPAIHSKVPTISGTDYDGKPTTIEPGKDGPLMIVVMAHWCPHCNREVPLLVEWKKSGKVPQGLDVVGVSTAVSSDRPNYPPGQWIEQMGWDWPVIADDVEQTAAQAYGVTGYPYITFIDADGNVVARTSGEQPIETLQALANATVESA
jgi:thiol-disulfide isomerase/thioredoxin